MKYGYEIYPVNCEESTYWIAESRASIKKSIENETQRTVYGKGTTLAEAVEDLEAKEAKWIEMADFCGLKIEESSKKTISSDGLKRRQRIVIFIIFLLSTVFSASSVVVDYKMLIGFFASLLFTTIPIEWIRTLNKNYTSTGFMSSMDKYRQYLETINQTMKKD